MWCCRMLPQTAELLGVPQSQWPSGSFESGQMVLDKSRHWRGLVMAMYINTYSSFWCGYAGTVASSVHASTAFQPPCALSVNAPLLFI